MERVDDDTLADLFWSVAGRMRSVSREQLAARGITPGMARGLRALLRHGELRTGQLADHLRIAARSSTEVVDALAERNLVERSPDPDDRRATLVRVTASGRRMGDAIKSGSGGAAAHVFDALSARDKAELARILRLLQD